ncbi:MAG: Gfo/Idh/MocA family oxidoreductase [Stappiaceae bacterium]
MIRVAIIGAGIGREHLAGYQAHPDRFSVRILCDLDMERAAEVVGGAPIRIEADFAAVLADPDVDLVDICLPPHLHFSATLDALRAGKHVVCEKPLVTSLNEVDLLIEAAQQTQRKLFPVFQYRFGLAMAQLQALIDEDLTGPAYAASLETHWDRDADYYAVPWRGTWEGESGGAVLGHAIHNHDLLTSIMGPVARLSAMTTTRVNDVEIEDCAAISFQMTSGAVATSSITLGAADNTSRIRVCFERLTAESGTAPYAPATDKWTFTARGSASQEKIDAVLAGVGDVHSGFAGFFEALANALDDQVANRAVTVQDGRQSVELVTAIYQAAREQRTVELPLGSENALYHGWCPSDI